MAEFGNPGTCPRALEPDEARALLRECVTVVRPGETLVIRVPEGWTPRQVDEYQRYADLAREHGRISFPVLVVIGGELAAAKPDPAAVEKHVEGILPALVAKEIRRQVSQAARQGRRPSRPGGGIPESRNPS